MHVERGVGDLDLAGEQQHRSHQQQDRSQEQDTGHHVFIEIGGDHRAERKNEGDRRAGLDNPDQAQPVAKPVDLKEKPFSVVGRYIVTYHLVMKRADQGRKDRIAIAEIDHHQRYRRKQHADDQNVLLH